MCTIHKYRLSNRSVRDVAIEEAAILISRYEGRPPSFWASILRWRVNHFKGDLTKALACQTVDGQPLFAWAAK